MRLEPTAFPATDLPFILAEPGGQLGLGQTEASADGEQPLREGLRRGLGVTAEEGTDGRMAPDGRPRVPQFPCRDSL